MGSLMEVTKCEKMAKNAFFTIKCPLLRAERVAIIQEWAETGP